MWDTACYHFHTHTHTQKKPHVKQLQSPCHSHCAVLYFLFWPRLRRITVWCFSSAACAAEMSKMLFTTPLAKGHDRVRTWCSRVVQHPLKRGRAEGWDCYRFSAEGRSRWKLFGADAQRILLHEGRCSAEAGPGGSELSEEGEISTMASPKATMKGWEQESLFTDYTQQQAPKFPVAVTQWNLP